MKLKESVSQHYITPRKARREARIIKEEVIVSVHI